jgi:RES domain-containing protein
LKVYRARAWRYGPAPFDPLDSSSSISGPKGWRFNDLATEILYTAEVESLALLEVAIRPGLETIKEIVVATIEFPDGLVIAPAEAGIVLPRNWNARPVAEDSRTIAKQFIDYVASLPPGSTKPIGLRVPSVLSATDSNVLIDPARKAELNATLSSRIPFNTLRSTAS